MEELKVGELLTNLPPATVVSVNARTGEVTGLEEASNKDASGGFVGKTLEKINFWNTARTFKSFLVNAATSVRTYTFPDKTGNVRVWSADSGWADITPLHIKDDLNAGWAMATVTGSRQEMSASSSNAAKTLFAKIHIPHDIVLNQADSLIHLHWEAPDTNAGNVIITVYISAGLRDGVFSSEYSLVFTLTPSVSGALKNVVTDVALPSGLEAYLVPDAIWTARVVRDRGTNATDTYASTVFLHTLDLHTRVDYLPTTDHAVGAGWVKV
jgi:hypothetical protein